MAYGSFFSLSLHSRINLPETSLARCPSAKSFATINLQACPSWRVRFEFVQATLTFTLRKRRYLRVKLSGEAEIRARSALSRHSGYGDPRAGVPIC